MSDQDLIQRLRDAVNAHSATIKKMADRINIQLRQLDEHREKIYQLEKAITEIKMLMAAQRKSNPFGSMFS
jgi:archaellum component FlaC